MRYEQKNAEFYSSRKSASGVNRDQGRKNNGPNQLGFSSSSDTDRALEKAGVGIEAIYPKNKLDLGLKNNEHKIYPYLLRGLKITGPNQVWGSDITYVRLETGFAYLVAIIDWFSRFTERLWRTVKQENIYLNSYQDAGQARRGLNEYFPLYNNLRRHQSLGYRRPAEVHFQKIKQTNLTNSYHLVPQNSVS